MEERLYSCLGVVCLGTTSWEDVRRNKLGRNINPEGAGEGGSTLDTSCQGGLWAAPPTPTSPSLTSCTDFQAWASPPYTLCLCRWIQDALEDSEMSLGLAVFLGRWAGVTSSSHIFYVGMIVMQMMPVVTGGEAMETSTCHWSLPCSSPSAPAMELTFSHRDCPPGLYSKRALDHWLQDSQQNCGLNEPAL